MRLNLTSTLPVFLVCFFSACSGPIQHQVTSDAAAPAAPREELLYLTSGRSIEQLAELAEIAPNVTFVSGLSREEAGARAAEFHGADAHVIDDEFLAQAENLRWVQAWSAGVDRYLGLEGLIENDNVTFTNMKGAHGPVISEHVFATLLFLKRQLGAFHDAQQTGEWNRRAGTGQAALSGSTLVVVGMGGIGREIAKRGHAFEMEVLGTVRTQRDAPDYCTELGTTEDLDGYLARADVVAIALPLTDETRGMFDAERIAKIKPGAMIVNIARGAIIDTDALLEALDTGHLGGAALDVTDPEPLPADHPLWGRGDVLITPHVAGVAELTGDRRWAIFRDNVELFGAGAELKNQVDKAAGY
ncbi:MAG: phosphoglycerate dehydrogenase-like enzyme [Planctomycetota bacterium]|jgi:phosphoglycerate dehydrogenase-like enzyme